MKSTGIVRRIDDLGRVVIPKEIRRSMRIREGDALEIYTTNDGCVCFKSVEPMDWTFIYDEFAGLNLKDQMAIITKLAEIAAKE